MSYGYLPHDDALRHAAKAVSEKAWTDILVMRPDFAQDHNPGWHAVLTFFHKQLGWNVDTLVTFSLVGLFLLFALAPLPWLRRPEAWLATLLASLTFVVMPIERLMLGRPLLISMAVLITLLFLWRRPDSEAIPKGKVLATTLLIAFAVWTHGAWYLFALPVGAFLLAGQRRQAACLAGCWLSGSVLGALATGHPWTFLTQAVEICTAALSQATVQRMLVLEFAPSDGFPMVLLLVALLLFWRRLSPDGKLHQLWQPIFLLAVITWILGLKVIRTWLDWGVPALMIWIALEFQDHLERWLPLNSLKRLAVTAGLAVAVILSATADRGGRWTWNLTREYLSAEETELAGWLPERGGVIYSSDMEVFYGTFYKNPEAEWKYVLGYEPTFMPSDDLEIYRRLQFNNHDLRFFAPWVKKMRPEDRIVLPNPPTAPGNVDCLQALEWHRTFHNSWIGRLKQTNTPSQVATTSL